ncbi:MAG: tail fiber domain-containing protein [Haliscomenobacter sp.]|nr:tail fiber domain-containing protein [Haliscomenobacter sp.]
MTMLPNGNLGIGATSPTAILHTVGSVRFQGLPAASHANALVVDNSGNLATRAFSSPSDITLNCTNSNYLTKLTGTNSIGCSQIFDNGSFVGIGTSSATQGILLSVNGNIQATGITTLSDKRFKTKTALLSNALSVILHLNPISFTWRQGNKENLLFDDKEHFGLIAQELEKEIPNLVYTSEDGTKSVNYTEMIPVLIKAIQEQQIEIETLKKELRETNGRKKRK